MTDAYEEVHRPRAPATPTPAGSKAAAPSSSPLLMLGTSPSASTRSGNDDTSSSAMAALVARVAATESTLSTLQAQVAQLAGIVNGALPPRSASGLPAPSRVFSPFDSPAPTPTSTVPSSAPTTRTSPVPSDNGGISALTQQVAALSTSVAQLQRLQTQSMNPSVGVLPPSPSGLHNGESGHGPSGMGMGRHMAPPPLDMINTSLSMGGPHTGALLSPLPNSGHPRGGFNEGPRTPVSRSFGSSLLGDGMDSKWGAPSPVKYGGGPNSAVGSGPNREWPSPGPSGPGANSFNGMGNNAGAAAPGAGIVVTKWEHLNLKVELLRSISKYGIGPPNKIQARVLPFMLRGSDIIAQAPPTQERIISYVIPALQLCLTLPPLQGPYRGPAVIIITTTVDQATQCHKLVRNVGGPLGVRVGLAAGAAGSSSLPNEVADMQRDAVQILIGTPAKINEAINTRGGLGGSECRLLILDEVDQLIARNLYEHVLNVARLLPSPRRMGAGGPLTPGATPFSPVVGSPYDGGQQSPFNPQSKTPFPSSQPSRFGTPGPGGAPTSPTPSLIERQTCLFSNTIPTDVINFSQSLQVRDPVRVLVRREGSTNSQESVSSITPGINLKHTYVYLTITGSARSEDQPSESGPGTIGSGRANAGSAASEEATRAKEYKLDTLVKMLDDYPLWPAIIHVGTYAMLEAVVYKLNSRQWDTLYLASDMPPAQRKMVLQQWRMSNPGSGPRFLVCFDVNPKPPDIPWTPLVINFDLPRSVEGYALRAAAAVIPPARPGQPAPPINGVIVSFVQAAGGDVEMLRSTECAYRFKSAEIPTVFHDLFQH